jgi:hypothetical protein
MSEDPSIAELAYRLWESRGRPADSAERDWLEAEARLAASKGASSASTVASAPPKASAKPKASTEPKAAEGGRKPRAPRTPKAAETRKPDLPREN